MTTQRTTPFLLFDGGGVRITGASLPAITYVSAEHIISQDTTSYPVESGAKINDHAVLRPARLNLEGLVGSLRYGNDTGLAVWQSLRAIAAAHNLLTVTTHYAQYADMLLRQASLPEGRGHGAGSRFRLELEQVLRASVGTSLGLSGVVNAASAPTPEIADQAAPEVTRRVIAELPGDLERRRYVSRIPDRAGD